MLAGCEAHRPFAQDRSSAGDAALLPPQGPGLWLKSLKGLPEAQALRVKDRVLAALHDEGIPASATNRNHASLILNGEGALTKTGDGEQRLDLHWRLRTPNGKPAGGIRVGKTLPATAWEHDPGPLDRLSVAAAQKIARLVRNDPPPPAPPPAIAIWPIDGAPGDGQQALAYALRVAMAQARFPPVAPGQAPDLVLLGDVRLGPEDAGQQPVAITWSLIRPGGEAVGTFTQTNQVPKGRLNAPWGSLAPDIATGAVAGLVGLIGAMGGGKASKTP